MSGDQKPLLMCAMGQPQAVIYLMRRKLDLSPEGAGPGV